MRVLIVVLIVTLFDLLTPSGMSGQAPAAAMQGNHLGVFNASIGIGYHNNYYIYGTTDQFRMLIPESEILQLDYSGFTQQRFNFILFNFYNPFVTSYSLGVRLIDKETASYRRNPQFRIGISYAGGNLITGSFKQEVIHLVDSVYSPVTGRYYYVDSVRYRETDVDLVTDQLRVDFAAMLSTNPDRSISFYTGAGIYAGIPVMSYASVEYIEGYEIINRFYNGTQTVDKQRPGEQEVFQKEVFQRSSSAVLIPYMPIGVNIRLSNRNRLLRQFTFFYERVNGIYIFIVPDEENLVSRKKQNSVGLRFSWQ